MFKLTITSSGKYLALWQIKPIGLHDGHLVGGEGFRLEYIFPSFLSIFVGNITIVYFCSFFVKSLVFMLYKITVFSASAACSVTFTGIVSCYIFTIP